MKKSCHSEARPLVVLGAAGTGLYMAESAERTGLYRVVGFLDDSPEKCDEDYGGIPVLGPISRWKDLPGEVTFINSLYSSLSNPDLAERILSLGIPSDRLALVIDRTAIVSPRATLGPGCFIGAGCLVEPMASMGCLSVLLAHVYIGHHTQVESYVMCANKASVAGGCSIGERSYIGAGAMIREYTQIGSAALVGMGAVVTEPVPSGGRVAGNPARPLVAR